MKLLQALGRAFLAFDQFAGRHWLKFVIAGGLILGTLTLRTCYEAGKYEAAVKANPPLRKKQARALVAQSRRDSAVVVTYKGIAKVARKKAAVDSARAAIAETKADSLQSIYENIPTSAAGPIADVQRFLANYTRADSTRTDSTRAASTTLFTSARTASRVAHSVTSGAGKEAHWGGTRGHRAWKTVSGVLLLVSRLLGRPVALNGIVADEVWM